MSISGISFIAQPTTNSVNIIVDNDFSHGGKYLLAHKHIWINNVVWEYWINDECVIKESDLDVFFTILCLEGHTISDIFANELYDEKSLFIFLFFKKSRSFGGKIKQYSVDSQKKLSKEYR